MMMSFWVASGLLLASAGQVNPTKGLSATMDALVTLGSRENPSGMAVQIDREGRFLAASSAAPTSTLTGYLSNGEVVTLRVQARDDITQLSLLKADNWKKGSGFVVTVAPENEVATQRLSAMLPGGVVQGQLVSQNRTGILQSSRRYVKLWEIRLESTQRRMGGAPVFTLDGRLAAILNATLEPYSPERESGVLPMPAQSHAFQQEAFGPQGMTVGYALGPKVLKRVVDGFLGPDQTPLHPTVGILFRNASGGGVELTAVSPGSSAERAGLRVGDDLLRVNSRSIPDAFSLAARLFESEIGEVLSFQVRREARTFNLVVVVESLAQARKRSDRVTSPDLSASTRRIPAR